ncbi:MAG: regulatory iron-sulfur-containing complex subunit RicT [candidate division WOR-3 bacterium]
MVSDEAQGAGRRTALGLVELHPFKSELCSIPEGLQVELGEMVVIRDEEGEDLGRLVAFQRPESESEPSDWSESVVVRKATEEDLRKWAELEEKASRARALFLRLKEEFRLEMKVVGAHWRLDRRKVCFYFVSEERLDFRALHKAVASALNVRVAIKQIGVRDYARVLGGLGQCGRELCCSLFLRELRPITLRMARQQNLFVEPAKISGLCGKLLCCLSHEAETYQQLIAEMPRPGTRVLTARGAGVVTGVDVLTRRVQVRFDDETELVVALEDLSREE